MKQYWVYMLTNTNNRTLYIGVTNDLVRRVGEHRLKLIEGFSAKYNLRKLVYSEVFSEVDADDPRVHRNLAHVHRRRPRASVLR